MKTTRAVLLAAVAALIVSVGAAYAHGHGESKKVAVNGKIVSVSEDRVSFVLHRSGGHSSRRAGGDVTVYPNPYTTYRRSDGTDATSADLAADQKVQVKGKYDEEGNLQAKSVLIKVGAE